MIDEQIYQYQEALKVFGNDQVLREAMTTYLETAEPMLGSVKSSYRSGWAQDVRKGVHWLKGGLSYLHAPRVREACLHLHQLTLQDPLPPLDEAIDRLESEMLSLSKTLQEYLAG